MKKSHARACSVYVNHSYIERLLESRCIRSHIRDRIRVHCASIFSVDPRVGQSKTFFAKHSGGTSIRSHLLHFLPTIFPFLSSLRNLPIATPEAQEYLRSVLYSVRRTLPD